MKWIGSTALNPYPISLPPPPLASPPPSGRLIGCSSSRGGRSGIPLVALPLLENETEEGEMRRTKKTNQPATKPGSVELNIKNQIED
jgi:hypothetical protein